MPMFVRQYTISTLLKIKIALQATEIQLIARLLKVPGAGLEPAQLQ